MLTLTGLSTSKGGGPVTITLITTDEAGTATMVFFAFSLLQTRTFVKEYGPFENATPLLTMIAADPKVPETSRIPPHLLPSGPVTDSVGYMLLQVIDATDNIRMNSSEERVH
jgi:hypothetical protein